MLCALDELPVLVEVLDAPCCDVDELGVGEGRLMPAICPLVEDEPLELPCDEEL